MIPNKVTANSLVNVETTQTKTTRLEYLHRQSELAAKLFETTVH